MSPIKDRVSQPKPAQIRAARKAAELTQAQAAALVFPTEGPSAYKAWQKYEVVMGMPDHRDIPLSTWELFLLMTNQHPSLKCIQKRGLKS